MLGPAVRKIAGKEPRTSAYVRALKNVNAMKGLSPVTSGVRSGSTTRATLSPSMGVTTGVATSFLLSRTFFSQVDHTQSSTKTGGDGHQDLFLKASVVIVPHPDKVHKGGEDAAFVSKDGRVMGVFDGVGAWSDMGVDPGQYARSLAKECDAAYEKLNIHDPQKIMEQGWLNSSHIVGSSTACCVALDVNASTGATVLKGANLGDSGFLVVREGQLLHAQNEQQHSFNFPYQLGTGSTDDPDDADCVELDVRVGDVVVVATDGVLDNLFPEEIVGIVREGVRLGKTEKQLAERIAQVAVARSKSNDRTPFSEGAVRAGYQYRGGKPDDITVICAIVEATTLSGAKL